MQLTVTLAGSIVAQLIVNPTTLPEMVQGQLIQPITLTASGGAGPPYSFTVVSGLPAGLAVSPAGVISGTLTGPVGPFSLVLSVADAQG